MFAVGPMIDNLSIIGVQSERRLHASPASIGSAFGVGIGLSDAQHGFPICAIGLSDALTAAFRGSFTVLVSASLKPSFWT